jgi:ATP-dependent DNA ligase
MPAKAKGRFIDPMLLLRTDSLPNDGDWWEYQLKFDGYRAIAFKTGGRIHLRSRNDNDFSIRYSDVVKGLAKLPDETVIDGEVIALDDDGRPSFNILQNYGSSKAPVLTSVNAGRLHIARRSGSHSGMIQQADHPHSGQTIGCYGKPALGGKD